MVFFRYDDRPGVIGRVGTLFGEAGMNIANMAVSRTNEGGRGADGALDRHACARDARRRAARAAGFDDASFIRLGSYRLRLDLVCRAPAPGRALDARRGRATRRALREQREEPEREAREHRDGKPEPFVIADVRGDDHPVRARAFRRRGRPQAGELGPEDEPRAGGERDRTHRALARSGPCRAGRAG